MGTTGNYDVKRDVDEALTGLRIALRASSEHLIERGAWKLVTALEKAEKFAAVTEPERTPETVLRAMVNAYEARSEELNVLRWRYEGRAGACDAAEVRRVEQKAQAAYFAADCAREMLYAVLAGQPPHADSHLADYEARLAGTRPLNAPPLDV